MPHPTELVRAATIRAHGIVGTLRSGHAVARGLAVADSRSFVRSIFLASAVRLDVLPFLRTPRPFVEIARFTDSARTDRLAAWLQIGVELHEGLDLDLDRLIGWLQGLGALNMPLGTIDGELVLDWSRLTQPFNMTRSPAGTVSAGFTANGLPIGLHVVGHQHADVAVLQAIAFLEDVLALDTVAPI